MKISTILVHDVTDFKIYADVQHGHNLRMTKYDKKIIMIQCYVIDYDTQYTYHT